MAHARFDRSKLRLLPLAERVHDWSLDSVLPLEGRAGVRDAASSRVAECMLRARDAGAAVVMLLGAHVLRSGVQRFLIDWLERGLLTHIGMNGGAAIHDFELALIGETTESVARYVKDGQFGLWTETGRLNDIARTAQLEDLGFGEAIGREIVRADLPGRQLSVLGRAYELGIPATVHVGIGYDIVHEHPNCDGAALGACSYADFLVLAHGMQRLSGGVLLNVGTAVMGPEVALKALSMVRNVAHQRGGEVRGFTSVVFDLIDLPADPGKEPLKTDPRYYFRPWKTLLSRVTADGGESIYVQGPHHSTLPTLHEALRRAEGRK